MLSDQSIEQMLVEEDNTSDDEEIGPRYEIPYHN